ncbi:hypothetical protein [Rufibacter latericius]|uniref:DUF5683 domain-containing protein n=1 Tax=Rufibacter latericius TaxID=2487040 RepID=A0A3M9MMI3_9BACT|nr:hypothetical protein [Rufibacter latericius]RNI25878.1 hypothetical protein EFB08_13615 [Rufibacter latericius]
MRKLILVLLALTISYGGMAQATLALATKPTVTPQSINLSLPSLPQETNPYTYKKRADRFLLVGLGLNIASAGYYLMAPGLYKKPYDPTLEYRYALEAAARTDPAAFQQLSNEYKQAMVVYHQKSGERDKKVRNARAAFASAFTLGMAFDVAAIFTFKKGRQ